MPASVESTAYFVVSEAVTNIVKHSGAPSAVVRVRTVGDVLFVEVSDSGRGGLVAERESGVQGMADRVAAVGGRVLVSSPEGGPTVLRAEIPCAAR